MCLYYKALIPFVWKTLFEVVSFSNSISTETENIKKHGKQKRKQQV